MTKLQNKYIFKPFSNKMTISDKIRIHVLRYKNNYFLNVEPDDISKEFDENVKPRVKVTKENLDGEYGVSRDTRLKVKKLAWVIDSPDDFAREFQNKLNGNLFSSVKKAELEAAAIYSAHCSDYQVKKATVYSENGVKRVKRKQTCNDIVSDNSSSEEITNEINKDQVLKVILNSVDFVRNAMLLDDSCLKSKLSENDSLNVFLKSLHSYSEPATKKQRRADYIVANLYKKISDLQM